MYEGVEVVLKDGRTGTVKINPQTGYVKVKFPFFIADDITKLPPPSEINKKFNDLIRLSDLTDESRLNLLSKCTTKNGIILEDDPVEEPIICKRCNDTGRYLQLDKLVDCNQCNAIETIRKQAKIDQHNAAVREIVRRQLEEGGSATLSRDKDGKVDMISGDNDEKDDGQTA